MRVGVIVPVHGFAPYLAETLDGILTQDRAPDDVVVVDDGSPEPVALHPDHAPHCRLIRRETRGGLPAARRTAFDALDTDWVALCDADDTWRPGKLAAQVRALEAAPPDAALCVGRAEIVGPDGRPTGERWDELPGGVHAAADLLPLLYERNPICVSSALVRRDAAAAAGGIADDFAAAEDWDLWLRLIDAGAAVVVAPDAVVAYRRHPGGMSRAVAALARAQLAVHERHAGLVGEDVRARVQAADLRALADGMTRDRRYADARALLRAAGSPAPPRARALAVALAVPGVRAALGRRDPY